MRAFRRAARLQPRCMRPAAPWSVTMASCSAVTAPCTTAPVTSWPARPRSARRCLSACARTCRPASAARRWRLCETSARGWTLLSRVRGGMGQQWDRFLAGHCVELALTPGVAGSDARPWVPHRCSLPPADGRVVLPWTPGDLMITYTLPGGWVTIRASGTEPKLKARMWGGSLLCSQAGPAARAATARAIPSLTSPLCFPS